MSCLVYEYQQNVDHIWQERLLVIRNESLVAIWNISDIHYILVSCSHLNILCYGIFLSRKCTVSCKDYPVVSTFMIYHRVCNKIITAVASYEALRYFSFTAPEFSLSLCRLCVAQPSVLCIAFCSSLLVLFRLVTALYVLPFKQFLFLVTPLLSSDFV